MDVCAKRQVNPSNSRDISLWTKVVVQLTDPPPALLYGATVLTWLKTGAHQKCFLTGLNCLCNS